ncbi:putative membrane protein [Bacteroides fragilis str. 3783N1-8]|nr:putative membrane protein [Bacteroides fragilis str. 3783N1-8]
MARQCRLLNFVDYIKCLVFYIQKTIDLLLIILHLIKIFFS